MKWCPHNSSVHLTWYIVTIIFCTLHLSYYFYKWPFFFQDFILDGGEKRERNITSMCGCLSRGPHWGLACNPGMCPDREQNQQHFGSQPKLNLLSYTSQGWPLYILNTFPLLPSNLTIISFFSVSLSLFLFCLFIYLMTFHSNSALMLLDHHKIYSDKVSALLGLHDFLTLHRCFCTPNNNKSFIKCLCG